MEIFVNGVQVRTLVNDLIAALDPNEQGQVAIDAFITWCASAPIEWMRTLQDAILMFHESSRRHSSSSSDTSARLSPQRRPIPAVGDDRGYD